MSTADFFVHPQGICESRHVGPGTRIWAFAHVLPNARIGRECNICDGVFIENDVTLGDRVTVKCGVQLWDGINIGDDAFIGPNATFTNDPFPRSKNHLAKPSRTVVGAGASIGANATILPGIEIGTRAMVGAGAVVTRSVPPHAIVMGNPARITGYVDVSVRPSPREPDRSRRPEHVSRIPGVRLIDFPAYEDIRGALAVAQYPDALPFRPSRFFTVFDVPGSEVRGEHAHRRCHQLLVCVNGQVNIVADDGSNREEFQLNTPRQGLYIPPMIWTTQYRHAGGTVLLVLASDPYDAGDYIRNYSDYIAEVSGGHKSAGA